MLKTGINIKRNSNTSGIELNKCETRLSNNEVRHKGSLGTRGRELQWLKKIA